jgi:hypothetical protein
VALVIEVSKEHTTSIFRLTRLLNLLSSQRRYPSMGRLIKTHWTKQRPINNNNNNNSTGTDKLDCGGAVARGSLCRPSCSLRVGRIQESCYPEDGGDMFLRNFDYKSHTMSHPRRRYPSTHKKNGVFWGVTPCGCCNNRRFEGS